MVLRMNGNMKRLVVIATFAVMAVCSQMRILSTIQEKHRLSLEPTDVGQKTVNQAKNSFPLFIGAGQGTTGTRSIHAAMCELGIPSVHYSQVCFRGSSSSNSTLFENAERGIEAHFEARDSWIKLQKCVNEARNQSQVCNGTLEIISTMRRHVTEVIKSGIGAVHDVPYVFMVPYIMKVAREERDTESVLIATERDPQEWAKRRVEKHQSTPQLVCKDPNGAFDIDYCLESGDATPDLLHAYIDCKDKGEQEEYISLLAESMTRYQEHMRQLSPEYRINLFESEQKISVTTITQSVWEGSKHKLPSHALEYITDCREMGGLRKEAKHKDGKMKCVGTSCRRRKGHYALYSSRLTSKQHP